MNAALAYYGAVQTRTLEREDRERRPRFARLLRSARPTTAAPTQARPVAPPASARPPVAHCRSL